MSVDPLTKIKEWNEKGWPWKYIYYPVTRSFPVPAGGSVTLPSPHFIYNYSEGFLLNFGMVTDHPKLSLRIQADPQLDTREQLQINAIGVGGIPNILNIFQLGLPPYTPPGIFAIYEAYITYFEDWAKISIFNPDTLPHTVYSYLFQMIVLIDKKTAKGGNQT